MKRIALTGATSMIGVAIVEEAIRNNVEVIAIVRDKSPKISRLPKSDLIKIISCNIDQMSSLFELQEKCDVFYHIAWGHTDKMGRLDPILQTENIGLTLEAVKLAHLWGCRKFVGAGSQAEYGPVDGIISIDTPTRPNTAYGIAKCAAGKLVFRLCEQYAMQCVWGRIFSVYGCNDNEGTLINYAIDMFLNNEIAHFSPATQNWNYLFETDAGKIFYQLGKIPKSGVYNIGHPETKKLKEYIEVIRENVSGDNECFFDVSVGDKGVIGIYPDVSNLMADIDFGPCVSFEEGIQKIVAQKSRRRINEKN